MTQYKVIAFSFPRRGGEKKTRKERLAAPPSTVLNGEKGYALETSPTFPSLAAKQFTHRWLEYYHPLRARKPQGMGMDAVTLANEQPL